MSTKCPNVSKYNALSASEKLELLSDYDCGNSLDQLCSEYGY